MVRRGGISGSYYSMCCSFCKSASILSYSMDLLWFWKTLYFFLFPTTIFLTMRATTTTLNKEIIRAPRRPPDIPKMQPIPQLAFLDLGAGEVIEVPSVVGLELEAAVVEEDDEEEEEEVEA